MIKKKKRFAGTERASSEITPFHLLHGDCLKMLKSIPDESIHAVVTDPPYHLTSITERFGSANSAPAKHGTDGAFVHASKGFMGKTWDGGDIAFRKEVWEECLRVLKPGGHLLAFSGSRTYHRMAIAIEDAGFEIRDQIMWVYSTGFPKSLDIGKAIDKKLGAKREVVGVKRGTTVAPDNKLDAGYRGGVGVKQTTSAVPITAPATEQAKHWDGWGTALKPAHEPIVMARKPLGAGTIAENVLTYGAGAINIDGCRVGTEQMTQTASTGVIKSSNRAMAGANTEREDVGIKHGRWPANFIHDGSDEVLELFPESNGGAYPAKRGQSVATTFASGQETEGGYRKMGDSGSAARFFYSAKTSTKERNEGLGGREKKKSDLRDDKAAGLWAKMNVPHENSHPTVKPISLMRYLCRLITPANGIVLDPFTGSGSTGVAALAEGFGFVGVEREDEYWEIAQARLVHAKQKYGR